MKNIFLKAAFVSLILSAGLISIIGNAEAKSNCGKASWYALKSRTASGEMMDASKLTAAHRSYRFGTKVRVSNRRNGRSVVVRINDRGPFIKGRIIDVSKAAARKLGFIGAGTASVCVEIL